jgi:hypothetical protein
MRYRRSSRSLREFTRSQLNSLRRLHRTRRCALQLGSHASGAPHQQSEARRAPIRGRHHCFPYLSRRTYTDMIFQDGILERIVLLLATPYRPNALIAMLYRADTPTAITSGTNPLVNGDGLPTASARRCVRQRRQPWASWHRSRIYCAVRSVGSNSANRCSIRAWNSGATAGEKAQSPPTSLLRFITVGSTSSRRLSISAVGIVKPPVAPNERLELPRRESGSGEMSWVRMKSIERYHSIGAVSKPMKPGDTAVVVNRKAQNNDGSPSLTQPPVR